MQPHDTVPKSKESCSRYNRFPRKGSERLRQWQIRERVFSVPSQKQGSIQLHPTPFKTVPSHYPVERRKKKIIKASPESNTCLADVKLQRTQSERMEREGEKDFVRNRRRQMGFTALELLTHDSRSQRICTGGAERGEQKTGGGMLAQIRLFVKLYFK